MKNSNIESLTQAPLSDSLCLYTAKLTGTFVPEEVPGREQDVCMGTCLPNGTFLVVTENRESYQFTEDRKWERRIGEGCYKAMLAFPMTLRQKWEVIQRPLLEAEVSSGRQRKAGE